MSEPFDFGDIVVCEMCGTTIPSAEAHPLRRLTYSEEHGRGRTTRNDLFVCPACYGQVLQKQSARKFWENPWLLFVALALFFAIILTVIALKAQKQAQRLHKWDDRRSELSESVDLGQ